MLIIMIIIITIIIIIIINVLTSIKTQKKVIIQGFYFLTLKMHEDDLSFVQIDAHKNRRENQQSFLLYKDAKESNESS